jgi:quinol monooxygenase YgiN
MIAPSIAPVGPPSAGEVIVVLTLRFKPGTADKVLEGVLPAVVPTRAEAGNNKFDVYRVTAQPDTLVIFERWESKEALDEHWQLSYTRIATDLFAEHLAEPIEDGRNVLYLTDMVSSPAS